YKNLRGFIDKSGNSVEDEAKQYEKEQRKRKKQDSGTDTYSQYVAETPFMPREAILTFDTNLLPTQEIAEQIATVEANKRYNFGTTGKLVETPEGIKFRFDMDAKPVYKFPHNKKDDVEGCVVIYESPQRVGEDIPDGMYIAVHDPYAQDTTTEYSSFSLGATYIIKRTNNFSTTMNDCIVACYVSRPKSSDAYNRQMFMLVEYYNAKIGFENDRGDVIGYAKRTKKLHMLEREFSFMDKK